MAKFQIKTLAGSLLFEGDFSSLANAVEAAIAAQADLRSANLRSADLSSADLRSANLGKIFAALPEMENPDAMILASIEKGGRLDMSDWHHCETTHCRAGWYIHHAGPAGTMLEAKFGPSAAGAIIFAKAYPKKKVPNFHAPTDEALADIWENAEAHAK